MMKRTLAVLAAVAATAAFGEMKVGTVDMMVLVHGHPRYESNKKLLLDTEKDYQRKLEQQKSELEKLQADGQKLSEQARNPMLAAAAKERLEKDLLDIQNKFLAGQQQLRAEALRVQQDLRDLEGRLLKSVTEDLRASIGAFARENGYDFVADASAIPFFKPELDVTDGVLKSMGVDPTKARAVENEGK